MGSLTRRIERQLLYSRLTAAQRRRRRWLAAFLAFATTLLAAELALRLAGYRVEQLLPAQQRELRESASRMLNEQLGTDAFLPDRFLLWKMKDGANVAGRDVNPLGLFGTPPSDKKSSGTVRILCMGDSVPALTYVTFPVIAERFLFRSRIARRFEILDASVVGYTSEQVLRRYRQLRRLQPDLVLVCVGWNDHAPPLNLPDCHLGYRTLFSEVLQRLFYWSRIHQWMSAPPAGGSRHKGPADFAMRVSKEQFEANLRSLIREVRKAKGEVLLVTQPWRDPQVGATASTNSPAESTATLQLSYHREYNDIVRKIAATDRVLLMDLEEEFTRRRREWLLESDGIHLSGAGHNLAARMLIGALRNCGYLSPQEFEVVVARARYESVAPDRPRARWAVEPSHAVVAIGQSVVFYVLVQNVGNTIWLREHVVPRFGLRQQVPYGGVEIFARITGQDAPLGRVTTAPLPQSIYPGESTSQTLVLAPVEQPGSYIVELGLRAAGIGELTRFGAESTTVSLTVRPE